MLLKIKKPRLRTTRQNEREGETEKEKEKGERVLQYYRSVARQEEKNIVVARPCESAIVVDHRMTRHRTTTGYWVLR